MSFGWQIFTTIWPIDCVDLRSLWRTLVSTVGTALPSIRKYTHSPPKQCCRLVKSTGPRQGCSLVSDVTGRYVVDAQAPISRTPVAVCYSLLQWLSVTCIFYQEMCKIRWAITANISKSAFYKQIRKARSFKHYVKILLSPEEENLNRLVNAWYLALISITLNDFVVTWRVLVCLFY